MTQESVDQERRRRIRDLNDQMRRAPLDGALGQLVITPAVLRYLQSDPRLVPRYWLARYLYLLRALAEFTAFEGGNDPNLDHDFAYFEAWDRTFFFRIDYYNKAGATGCPDPANPAVTRRVLTIGFAEDS